MIHYIIVRYTNEVTDKTDLYLRISELFSQACSIPGIDRVQVFSNCVERANRHDLMIKMELEPEALERFDRSEIHKKWKDVFGCYIAEKTIFDCE